MCQCDNSAIPAFSISFLMLTDALNKSYTGQANNAVVVDPTGVGLVFAPIVTSASLTSTLANYVTNTTFTTYGATVASAFSTVNSAIAAINSVQATQIANLAAATAGIANLNTEMTAQQARPHFFRNGTSTPPTGTSFTIGDIFLANQT